MLDVCATTVAVNKDRIIVKIDISLKLPETKYCNMHTYKFIMKLFNIICVNHYDEDI